MIGFKKDQIIKTHCTQQSIDLSKIITKKKDQGKIKNKKNQIKVKLIINCKIIVIWSNDSAKQK